MISIKADGETVKVEVHVDDDMKAGDEMVAIIVGLISILDEENVCSREDMPLVLHMFERQALKHFYNKDVTQVFKNNQPTEIWRGTMEDLMS